MGIGGSTKRGKLPVGAVLSWLGGYFTSAQSTYTNVLASANTVTATNTYLNPKNLYVCNGAVPNKPASPIFNAASRYLPKLTDDRNVIGNASAGSIGGANAVTLSANNLPTHTHAIDHDHAGFDTQTAAAHTHNLSGDAIGRYYNQSSVTTSIVGINDYSRGTGSISGGTHTHTSAAPAAHSGNAGSGTFTNSALTKNPLYLNAYTLIKII